LRRVVAGRLNKQIAAELGIVEKTIKVIAPAMMRKMNAVPSSNWCIWQRWWVLIPARVT